MFASLACAGTRLVSDGVWDSAPRVGMSSVRAAIWSDWKRAWCDEALRGQPIKTDEQMNLTEMLELYEPPCGSIAARSRTSASAGVLSSSCPLRVKFLPEGGGHFVKMFCAQCRTKGIVVPAARVRVLTRQELHSDIRPARRSQGLWTFSAAELAGLLGTFWTLFFAACTRPTSTCSPACPRACAWMQRLHGPQRT